MAEHDDPTTAAINDPEQDGERLDADKLREEFPQRPIAAFEHGTTEREMREGESLDDRLDREVPDVGQPTPSVSAEEAAVRIESEAPGAVDRPAVRRP